METTSQRYYRKNKAKRRANYDQWAAKNREHIATKKREWYQKNKERITAKRRQYRADNPETTATTNKRSYNKMMNDPIRKAQHNKKRAAYNKQHIPTRIRLALQARVSRLLKFAKTDKTCGTTQLLGCSIPKLKAHLESLFTDDMSWDNYGRDGWHIDHIQPCKDFNLTIFTNQLLCFHYTNLRPLWAKDNLARRFTD